MTSLRIYRESSDENGDDFEFLPQLPYEMSKLILGHIFTLDPGALGVLRSVCKDWGSITRPPSTSINLGHHKFPYLVRLVNSTCKFFHPTYNHIFYVETPELENAHIKFSKFGWLLLSRYIVNINEYEYFFFNPLTRETKHLPNESVMGFASMCFSSPPTSSDCFVVGVSTYGFELAIARCGDDRWEFIMFENWVKQRVRYCHPVIYKDKVYCLGENMKLIVLDAHTRRLNVVGKTFVERIGDVKRCHLVEDEQGMLGIFFLTQRKAPLVMSMDLSQTKKEWRVVHELKNRLVYTSPAASWSDLAPTKSTSNKIYFPLFQDSSNIFFSLSTDNYHSFAGNYTCNGVPCGAERITNCAWISIPQN